MTIDAVMQMGLVANKVVAVVDETVGNQVKIRMSLPAISPGKLSLGVASTPVGQDGWSGKVTMSGGTATIDLTNATQVGLTPAVNLSTLKIYQWAIYAPATNSGTVSIGTGGSNGNASLGVQSQMKPGDYRQGICTAPVAIDATHKNLDVTGSGTDAIEVVLICGP